MQVYEQAASSKAPPTAGPGKAVEGSPAGAKEAKESPVAAAAPPASPSVRSMTLQEAYDLASAYLAEVRAHRARRLAPSPAP